MRCDRIADRHIQDVSIHGPNKDCHWLNIEEVSPVLQFSDIDTTKAMLASDLIKQNFRVSTNNTARVHVHIGNGENSFDLETVQRAMGFMYIFDELLAPIHPPSRQDHDYAQNIRAAYRRRLRGSRFEAPSQIFRRPIDRATQLAFGWHRPAVNKKNLCNDGVRGKKTIEFRPHTGTFEKQRIQA